MTNEYYLIEMPVCEVGEVFLERFGKERPTVLGYEFGKNYVLAPSEDGQKTVLEVRSGTEDNWKSFLLEGTISSLDESKVTSLLQ